MCHLINTMHIKQSLNLSEIGFPSKFNLNKDNKSPKFKVGTWMRYDLYLDLPVSRATVLIYYIIFLFDNNNILCSC